jgi:hypothetical protein
VSGKGVQQAFLKLVEGAICSVPLKGGRKHPEQDYICVDTTNILFIAGGAFVGLDQIIAQRMFPRRLGFGAINPVGEIDGHTDRLRRVQSEDLLKFWLIPEFVGRFTVVTTPVRPDGYAGAHSSAYRAPPRAGQERERQGSGGSERRRTMRDETTSCPRRRRFARRVGRGYTRDVIIAPMKQITLFACELRCVLPRSPMSSQCQSGVSPWYRRKRRGRYVPSSSS